MAVVVVEAVVVEVEVVVEAVVVEVEAVATEKVAVGAEAEIRRKPNRRPRHLLAKRAVVGAARETSEPRSRGAAGRRTSRFSAKAQKTITAKE